MSNYTRIKARVTDQALHVEDIPVIASGCKKALLIKFTFCPLWDGLTKTAVFRLDTGEAYHKVMETDTDEVPHEVLASDGKFFFGVYGMDADGLVRPTVMVPACVQKGAVSFETAAPEDPTPDVYQQILSAYGGLSKAVALESARLSELIATKAINGTFTETAIEGDGYTGTILSNGTHAYISLKLSGVVHSGDVAYSVNDIPACLSALQRVQIQPTATALQSKCWLTIFSSGYTQGDYARAGISVAMGESIDTTTTPITFQGFYPLSQMYIHELADMRIGPDGTTYPTAGEAMRAMANNMTPGGDALMLEAQESEDGSISWVGEFNWEAVVSAVQENNPVAVQIEDANGRFTYYHLATAELEDSRLVFNRPLDAHTVSTLFVNSLGYITKHSYYLGTVSTVNGEYPDEFGNVQIKTGGSVDLSNYYTRDETNQLAQEIVDGLEIPSNAFIYEEAFAAAEYVVAREIGDISSALDRIIALQEELIGT